MSSENIEACVTQCDAIIKQMSLIDDLVDRKKLLAELQVPLTLLKEWNPIQYQRIYEEASEICGHGSKGFIKNLIETQIKINAQVNVAKFTNADLAAYPSVNGVPVFTPQVVEAALSEATGLKLQWDNCGAKPYFTALDWEVHEPPTMIDRYAKPSVPYHAYDDYNKIKLKIALNSIFPAESRFANLDEVVEEVAKHDRVDFYQDWLLSFENIDDPEQIGKRRINDPNECFAVTVFKAPKEKWSATWSRQLVLSIIHRCLSPGCDLRNYFAIEGEQNIGKSKFCSRLVPSRWFTKGHINKDNEVEFARATYDRGIVEMDEEGGLDKGSVSTWKSITTNPVSTFRRMRANDVLSYPKRCIYIITTNNFQYLNDPSGNTRCLPITSGLMRNEFVDWDAFDRDWPFILSEGIRMYREGIRPFLLADEIPEQIKQTTTREIIHEEEEWVEAYLSGSDLIDGKVVENSLAATRYGFRTDDVIAWISGNDLFPNLPINFNKFKINTAIKKHGFTSMSVKVNGMVVRKWVKRNAR